MAGVHLLLRSRGSLFRVGDAPEKSLDSGQIDRNHLSSHMPMSVRVNSLGRMLIWSIDQTKRGPSALVEPVGKELDPILLLNRQVPQMHVSDLIGCHSG